MRERPIAATFPQWPSGNAASLSISWAVAQEKNSMSGRDRLPR